MWLVRPTKPVKEPLRCHISSRCEDQVMRFLFSCKPVCCYLCVFLQVLMTVGRIEKLFMSHRQWNLGDVGVHCLDETERKTFSQKQQFVLQFFLGFLKIQPLSREHQFLILESYLRVHVTVMFKSWHLSFNAIYSCQNIIQHYLNILANTKSCP